MKKILFSLIALFAFQFGHAQSLDSLYGKWQFDGVYTSAGDSVDSTQIKMVNQMFESMSINIKKNNIATLSMFDKDEDAKYVYDEKKKTFTVTTGDGRKVAIEVLEFTSSRMAIKMMRDMKLWLKLE